MLSSALIRQYANGARVSPEVAGQDIALHYALALLNDRGLIGRPPGGGPLGPLLFKGGTALRKCVFGSLGRFSEDIDLDAERKNGFEAEIEELFQREYHGLRFHFANIRYSDEENFSGTVEYAHEHGQGTFELQISYRMTIILPTVDLPLEPTPYQARVEFGIPTLHGLDPYEMIAEKTDLKGLVPRNQTDREPDEETLLADQTSHREVSLFERLSEEARAMRRQFD